MRFREVGAQIKARKPITMLEEYLHIEMTREEGTAELLFISSLLECNLEEFC
eukprot:UN05941